MGAPASLQPTGVLRLELKTTGEVVAEAIPTSAISTGASKARGERGVPGVTPSRTGMDYCAAMNMELGSSSQSRSDG